MLPIQDFQHLADLENRIASVQQYESLVSTAYSMVHVSSNDQLAALAVATPTSFGPVQRFVERNVAELYCGSGVGTDWFRSNQERKVSLYDAERSAADHDGHQRYVKGRYSEKHLPNTINLNFHSLLVSNAESERI